MNNYSKVEKALFYISENFKHQPSLKEVANQSGLSELQFQKVFTEWAGISPKKFLQCTNINYAKEILRRGESVEDATYRTGLSGTSRLHNIFINILTMTPSEYNNGGRSLIIKYSFNTSKFGDYLVASTSKGICEIIFGDSVNTLKSLRAKWPNAILENSKETCHTLVFKFIDSKLTDEKLTVHIRGTNFQIKVWEALLKIPKGKLSNYGEISKQLNCKAYRAVGYAVGSNPIAYIIPCHRVINSTGVFGNYRWGKERKLAMLGCELSSTN